MNFIIKNGIKISKLNQINTIKSINSNRYILGGVGGTSINNIVFLNSGCNRKNDNGQRYFSFSKTNKTFMSTENKIFDQELFGQFSMKQSPNTRDNNNTYSITLIDNNGLPTETKFQKMDLLHELKIQARDLRTVDPSFPPQMPTILVRERGILISIGAVRAIIQHDRVYLFETQNKEMGDDIIQIIRETLNNQYESLPLPFEFKVFEGILDFVCRKLDGECKRMQTLIEKELQLLNQNPEHNLEDLFLYHKKGLNQFQVSVQEIIDATTTLLQSDEDMALMYLSHRATGGKRQKNLHDEIEILLETYTRQLEQMENNISQLKETLNSTEEFVNFQLDTARNKMMGMNLMISLVTISTGLGGVVTGVFGMNLTHGLEASPFAFPIAVGCISTIGLITFLSLRFYCKVKNILPYTKPNGLKFGVGFKNDSFSNPLKESILDLDFTGTSHLGNGIHNHNHNHNHNHTQNMNNNNFKQIPNKNELFLREQLKQQQHQILSQQYQLQLQQNQIQHQHQLLETNNILPDNPLVNAIGSQIKNNIRSAATVQNDNNLDFINNSDKHLVENNNSLTLQGKKKREPEETLSSYWKFLKEN